MALKSRLGPKSRLNGGRLRVFTFNPYTGGYDSMISNNESIKTSYNYMEFPQRRSTRRRRVTPIVAPASSSRQPRHRARPLSCHRRRRACPVAVVVVDTAFIVVTLPLSWSSSAWVVVVCWLGFKAGNQPCPAPPPSAAPPHPLLASTPCRHLQALARRRATAVVVCPLVR